jgi:hypothetical protein
LNQRKRASHDKEDLDLIDAKDLKKNKNKGQLNRRADMTNNMTGT